MFGNLRHMIRQEIDDIWHNIKECFEGGDTVAVGEIVVETMTAAQAALRHGAEDGGRSIARMCRRGQRLAKKYEGASKVPEKEKKTALFGKKVGKYWYIPVPELDRVFL